MGAAETKAGHEEENVDGTSAAPWLAPVRRGETKDFVLLGR